MGDNKFPNKKIDTMEESNYSTASDHYMAMYYKMRREKQTHRESMGSNSSLSLLSINRNSLMSGSPEAHLSLDSLEISSDYNRKHQTSSVLLNSFSEEMSQVVKKPQTSSTVSTETSVKRSNSTDNSAKERDTFHVEPETPDVFKRPKTPPWKDTSRKTIEMHPTYTLDAERLLEEELAKAEEISSRVKSSLSRPPVMMEYFKPSLSPQTPHIFRDELGSLTPEATTLNDEASRRSSVDFPFRDQGEVLNILEKDEKKFVPNTSGFSHNSSVTHFTVSPTRNGSPGHVEGRNDVQQSIGEFFSRYNSLGSIILKDKENSVSESYVNERSATIEEGKGQSTMSAIHHLLDMGDMSGTAICEQILGQKLDACQESTCDKTIKKTSTLGMSRRKELTLEASRLNMETLSQSRQSTPIALRTRDPPSTTYAPEATPLRPARLWKPGRIPMDTSTPKVLSSDKASKNEWQQLRQTHLEEESCNGAQQDDKGIELEKTIGDGDLTLLSQRIGDLPPYVPDPHSPLLGIVKKLADLPTGTVDCTALTPMIRSEFPELLVEWESGETRQLPVESNGSTLYSPHSGSWIKVGREHQSVVACVHTEKAVNLPMASRDLWLLVRVSAIEAVMNGRTVKAERRNDAWVVGDSLAIKSKEVVLPPGVEHRLQLTIVCSSQINGAIQLHLQATDIENGRSQQPVAMFFLSAILPTHGFVFCLLPSPTMSFGTLPAGCFEDHTFKLTHRGDCEVPIVCILEEKNSSQAFQLTKNVTVNGKYCRNITWKDEYFETTIPAGRKQTLEFDVRFSPQHCPGLEDIGSMDVEAEVRVELRTVDGMNTPMARCRVQGSAGFAKFLCRSDSSPVVFHASQPGISITKQFHLKNGGAIPLKVALQVVTDTNTTVIQTRDDVFTVPDFVALPLDETVAFDITFDPRQGENYIRRYLSMHLEPNGRTSYDVELIGSVAGGVLSSTARSSKASVKSGSSSTGSLALKLTSSNPALSWTATPLHRSVVKDFQIKIKSLASATARISLASGSSAFKIINERNEALDKMRKTLKPGVPMTINVRFKPDTVGIHQNFVAFEFDGSHEPSTVQLTGLGGCPKLRVEDTSLDLNGNRMIKLIHPKSDSCVYMTQFRVTNYGSLAGFVHITPTTNVLSVAHALRVYPVQAVLEPKSNIVINVSQNLSRLEVRDILSTQEIRKMATLTVVMGDEPSRQRLRGFIGTHSAGNQTKKLVEEFPGEIALCLQEIKEAKEFETIFLNSLVACDVVVVLEKTGVGDITVVEFDESSRSFATISNTILVEPVDRHGMTGSGSEHSQDGRRKKSPNSSSTSATSQDLSAKKVQDWLRKVE